MKTYKVTIQRVEYMRAEVVVEAADREEAERLANECDSDEFVTVNAEQRVDGVKEVRS